jgi:site-specific recombinase XerD
MKKSSKYDPDNLSPLLKKFCKRKRHIVENTRKGYLKTLFDIEDALEELRGKNGFKLEDLTRDAVVDYFDIVTSRNTSASYIYTKVGIVKAFCGFLYEEDLMRDKEYKKIKVCLRDIKEEKGCTTKEQISDDDIELVFKRVHNELHRMVFWVCLNYGLRPNEVCELTLKDVMLNRDPPVLRIKSPMGQRWRYILIKPCQVPVWESWFEAMKNYGVEHDWIFFSTIRRKMKSLVHIFNEISKASGLRIYSYRLRYTYALTLWRCDVAIPLISKMLGHSNTDTTIGYLPTSRIREIILARQYRHRIITFNTVDQLTEEIIKVDPYLKPFVTSSSDRPVTMLETVLTSLSEEGLLKKESSGILVWNHEKFETLEKEVDNKKKSIFDFDRLPPLLQEFCKRKKHIAEITRKNYLRILFDIEKILEEMRGENGFKLEDLTRNDVMDYFENVMDRGYLSATVYSIGVVIRVFSEFLNEEELMSDGEHKKIKSYLKDIKLERGEDKREAMTDGDIGIVFKVVQNELNRMVFWVCLNYGIRPSEACKLKLEDVMLEKENPELRIENSKGKKWRYVPITTGQIPVWGSWFEARKNYGVEHDLVFFNTRLGKLYSLQVMFENISKASGLHIYPYRLRYTYAVKLWRNKVDILVISKMLGHSNIDTTMRYLRVEENEIADKYLEQTKGLF